MIESPLLIISLLLLLILLLPLACRKLHIPSIVGFILLGVVLGPFGLTVLPQNETIHWIGKIGMLYIMFQAGVEIDVNNFSQYKFSSVGYGLLSFILPFGLGILTSRLLGFGWGTCILLGAMYGSHTLMTYPIVSRYGIQKNAAVNIVVGGTMIAISLSLIVLTVIKGQLQGAMQEGYWWLFASQVVIFLGIVLWGFPKVVQWFTKRHDESGASFILVMLLLTLSAGMAHWVGLEDILGAFICGVALNRCIPNLSPLMQRINFVGNSIFVPIFLLDVGMMIDVSLCWSSWHTLLIAGVMIATKLLGKWLAAWSAQGAFHLNADERQLIFGLTHATAAGTLAIVTIGFQIGLFDANVLNGAVLMILVLCILSSFITEHASKEIALKEETQLESDRTEDEWIVMSVGAEVSDAMRDLCHLSQLRDPEYQMPSDWVEAKRVVERSSKSIAVYHQCQPLSTINRLIVAVPRYAEKEHDFISCFGQIRRLSSQIGAKVIFYANKDSQRALRAMCQRPGKYLLASYRELEDWEDVLVIAKEIEKNDMLVVVSSRRSTASYNPLFERLPDMLTRFFDTHNYLLIYPEQMMGTIDEDALLSDVPQTTEAWRVVTATKRLLVRLIHYLQTR